MSPGRQAEIRRPRAALPAAEGLWGALLCDDGERIAPVSSKDLDALGVSLEEAFERALANADALTERAPEAVRWFDLEHGRVVTCEFNDPGGAGRLLSPAARELILQVLGAERAFAIAPTRDALLACDAEDAEGTRLLAREARQRFDDGPFPLTPRPWLLTADGVEAAAAPPEEPSGEQDPDAQDEAPEESP